MIQLRRHGTVIRALVLALIASLLVAQGMSLPARAHPGHGDETFNALIFSKTAGFRHDSIPAGIQAITELAAANNFTVTATEDASLFNDTELAKYEVVIWLSTTGDVLNADQQAAFERYIRAGGGYAGVHAASDTEYDWPWYGQLVGSYFDSHPPGTPAGTVKVEDHAHPSTADAPTIWQRTDEWCNYRTNPRDKVHVLASLDESSYTGGNMGPEHPITWCQDYDGGRAWYTGMGHTIASYAESAFRQLLLGGIKTAAGVQAADPAARSHGRRGHPGSSITRPPRLDAVPEEDVVPEEAVRQRSRGHGSTDHPVHRPVGRPAVRGGGPAGVLVGVRRAGDRLLG